MSKQELGPNQLKWIDALESGKYQQCTEWLNRDATYCCLGVGCEVMNIQKGERSAGVQAYGEIGRTGCAPHELVEALALRDDEGRFQRGVKIGREVSLVGANDKGATFAEIAAFCRAHPESVFTEPR